MSFPEGVYFHAVSFADLKTMFGAAQYAGYHWHVHPDDPVDAKRIVLGIFLFLGAR